MNVDGSGGPPANPLMMRLFELIDDGEWHEVEPLLREVGKMIPPGQAIRRAELRRRNSGHATPLERRRPVSEERQIVSGQRSFARDTINSARTHVEVKFDEDGVEHIRMLSLPPRVRRDRARARAHHHFDAADLADEIGKGADARALINELSPTQLYDLALELAKREAARQFGYGPAYGGPPKG